jgi:uncharacterized protein (TIGR02001 family)
MKFSILAAVLISTFAAASTRAAEVGAPTDLSFNAAVTSDYRYRAISQTRLQPALQGGADFVHNSSGLYAGAWASIIKWTSDAGGSGDAEIDLYAGKRGELAAGLGYDLGVLRYLYPSNGLGAVPGFANADTTEIYGQLSWGPASLKYSHALTNLFGFADSKDSGYLDLAANLEAGQGWVVNLHAGRQRIAHNGAASYTDWKVGLTRDFGIVTGAVAYVGSNADKRAYASPANGKFLGKLALVLTVSKTF